MHLLFLSHCVPNPPDKGERIRAFHQIRHLARRYRVHLACFGNNKADLQAGAALQDICASVHVELVDRSRALVRAAARFGLGGCLNQAFYGSPSMKRYVDSLTRHIPLCGTLAYTAVMMPYAPPAIPVLLDMVDVDSEKWLHYSRWRRPGFVYAAEARRLRRFETNAALAASRTFLTTRAECAILESFAPAAAPLCLENGIDGDYFGEAIGDDLELASRRFVTFVGTMDYAPNIDAAGWFAAHVFPSLRNSCPDLEFFVVGRNPAKEVLRLKRLPGVVVTGAVADVRPYIRHARAVVAPLRLARGVQNKVLEALAMGREVYASEAVCITFGTPLPGGLIRCGSPQQFVDGLLRACAGEPAFDPSIQKGALERFTWSRNLGILEQEFQALLPAATGAA